MNENKKEQIIVKKKKKNQIHRDPKILELSDIYKLYLPCSKTPKTKIENFGCDLKTI